MNRLKLVKQQREQRKNRVRGTVSGTSERPRLSVYVSNRHVTAQIIDDTSSKTLAYATSVGQKSKDNMTEIAKKIGAEIAKKGKAAKVSKVVLDRGSKIYHGRIKALADAAREGGLEF